jgi:excisionase family DNA binding protein
VAGEVRYYTVEDAARMLRLTPERVREMLKDGEIEGMKTGDAGGWRVPLRGELTGRPAPAPESAILTNRPTEVGEQEPEEPVEPEAPTPEPAEAAEETRQPVAPHRGEDAAITPEATSESGWVTTQQAARALGISARTVRWHIERGNLDANPEGEGVERTWKVSVDSLQAFRDSRRTTAQSPRDYRAPAAAAEIAEEDHGDAIRALADRLVEEARRAEAARVRLELAERAQSTLEAELAEERRRREEAERAREGTERELEELRKRLEAERARAERADPRPPSPSPQERPREVVPRAPETPAQGFGGTDAAGGGPQRQTSPRWWRWWRQ